MKHALHLDPGHHGLELSDRKVRVVLAIVTALAPYVIGALAVFVYHQQFGL